MRSVEEKFEHPFMFHDLPGFLSFIDVCFDWDNTPEGRAFWLNEFNVLNRCFRGIITNLDRQVRIKRMVIHENVRLKNKEL